jgi:hypothetical protein
MLFMLVIGALAFLYVLMQNKKTVAEPEQVSAAN